MYVIDLEGTQHPIQTTIKQEYELNGNQTLTTLIKSNKVNDVFIKDISQMWSIVDFDDVEYKIIYFKRKGEGSKMTVDIKSIPLFFHAFNKDRIYEEYNDHMTAEVAFGRIFGGTKYNYVIHGNFKAVQWKGFGAGEPRLETFKRALERYKAEFEIKGNTIHLKNLIGRDTQFQYRHRLNASNIEQEVDAKDMWTYARGYGNYGDGEGEEDWKDAELTREYTSPLAEIAQIGKLHAPPIKNGNVTDVETMDKDLKTLVDESIKVSVSATLHDLRKQGYELAQPQKGDRIFLIDERINFDQEIRVVFLATVKNWKGEILELDANFGGASLTKRHQANIDTAIKNINEIVEGNQELPYNVLDEAVRRATESLKSAQTELIFDNGIIAQEKLDPNRFVILNSKGIGITDDGGGTFKEAITADGFVLSAGAIGRLSANHIQIGPETEYGENYDPSTKETPAQAQAKIDAMKNAVDKEIDEVVTDLNEFGEYIEHAFKDGVIEEAEAIAIEKYINSLESEKGDVDSRYTQIYNNSHLEGTPKTNLLNAKVNYNGAHNELITAINTAIADGKTTVAEKGNVDSKFLAYRSNLANLEKRFEQAIDKIAQGKADKAKEDAKEHADGNDTVMRENLRLTSALPTSLSFSMDGITASTVTADAYARLDHRGIYIKGGAIQIDGGLADEQIGSSGGWNDTKTEVDNNKNTWSRASFINSDGTFNSSNLKGKLTESQMVSAEKWNNQGTYLGSDGIYTGVVVANQLISGTLDTDKIKVRGGDSVDYTEISGSTIKAAGKYTRTWFGETETHKVNFQFAEGLMRVENEYKDRRLWYSDTGISTFKEGYDEGSTSDTEYFGSGVIDFYSHIFNQDAFGLTLFSNRGTIGLKTEVRDIVLDAKGSVIIQNDNLRTGGILNYGTDTNLYAGVSGTRDGELRVTNRLMYNGGDIGYMDVRARDVYANLKTNYDSGNVYIMGHTGSTVNLTNMDGYNDGNTGYIDVNFANARAQSIRSMGSGANFYIGVSTGELRVTNNLLYNNGNIGWRAVAASSFNQVSSLTYKSNIKNYEGSALDVINELDIVTFNYKDDNESKLGFISEYSGSIATENNDAVDIAKVGTYNTRGIQELHTMFKCMQQEINILKGDN